MVLSLVARGWSKKEVAWAWTCWRSERGMPWFLIMKKPISWQAFPISSATCWGLVPSRYGAISITGIIVLFLGDVNVDYGLFFFVFGFSFLQNSTFHRQLNCRAPPGTFGNTKDTKISQVIIFARFYSDYFGRYLLTRTYLVLLLCIDSYHTYF